ncbi:putative C6 zinc finger domain-containing protein [Rosellinia necatrix]|uniref:Putative C6 zinc finger domain-containing protein n=1 Tax=Rosellinia necatrix TaxID=77044 RepID=A0A1S7UK37_ROSNE|nr:putative C6 zinc finger domain-containing protein [Rosellinia necatrix]
MSSGGVSSRQRNCNACVKSKRRCDKRQPACSRCVRQRYPCVYSGRGQVATSFDGAADTPFGQDPLTNTAPNSDAFTSDSNALPAMLDMNIDLDPNAVFQISNDFNSLLVPVPGNVDFLANLWPPQLTESLSVPFEKSLTRKDYSRMVPVCDEYAPWQLADPSTKAFFTMSALKRFHVNFANHSCNLYIHRYLYKDNMPRWVLQAFTMCLLYTNQTASNRAVVLRVLHENVTDLKATAGNTALTPQEKLARVHALMFYQTIRMFDGDITLGQQADDDMTLLESWNKDLCKVKDNLNDLASKGKEVSEHPPESWERWVFAESLRRTCIVCFSIQKFWALLKTRLKSRDIANWDFSHRWTLSRVCGSNSAPCLVVKPLYPSLTLYGGPN